PFRRLLVDVEGVRIADRLRESADRAAFDPIRRWFRPGTNQVLPHGPLLSDAGTARNIEHLTAHEARLLRGQEQDGRRYVLGLPGPPHRYLLHGHFHETLEGNAHPRGGGAG